jgi:hypothetical protein
MLAYASLSRSPRAFRSLTGMSPAEFQSLLADFSAALQRLLQARPTNQAGQPRRRAAGAGHPYRHDDCHRLLMALVWLRVYPTYELLGFFFGLHKRNAQLNVRAVLAVLDTLGDFPFDRPDRDPERPRLSNPAQVMDAFPAVRLVIDGKEQRVQRPRKSREMRCRYHSGKQKAFTLKSQVAVSPTGLIESVSVSVPGGANHDLTLLRQTKLLDRLREGEGAMMDKGYDGIRNTYPELPLVLPFRARRNLPLAEKHKAFNRVVGRYRVVVEHAIAQLNRFMVLRQVFRGRLGRHPEDHSRAVRVVAGLVNRRTRVCPLKSYAPAA